jgi:L-iditol 2-dehydrogenase
MDIHRDVDKMRAAVWHGPKDLRLEEVDLPKVVPGSLLLLVKGCAICGSDLRIFNEGNSRITKPTIVGHEVSGEVVGVGEGINQFEIGDRVSVGADVPCGECVHCLSGRGNCCDINYAIGYQFNGGYAEYMLLDPLVVSHGPVHKFSKNLSWDLAALAEPLACCINGYERALFNDDSKAEDIVIFGAGPIGLMLLMLGIQKYYAKNIIMVEPSEKRRMLAESLGATHIIDPTMEDPVSSVLKITNGQGVRAVFTANSVVETHEQAIAMIGKRGVVNLFGGLPKNVSPIALLSNHLHYKEAYLTGSHGSTPEHHGEALSLIESNKIDLTPLISKSFTLDSIIDGFAMARSTSVAKVIIHPNG